MREKPQPDPVPAEDPPPHPAEPLQITTPVIQLQAPAPARHEKLEPTIDGDLREFAREDEDALIAIEDFEKMLRHQAPG
jgi:hypothetical protein